MRTSSVVHVWALAGCAWLTLGTAAFADVQISMRDGQVSIAAKDATVRQILTEWARVGRTRIVNVERIPGVPITIELKNVPERDALDTLLRLTSGYIAAPRAPVVSDASLFDRIIVMPTAAAPITPTAPLAPPPFAAQAGPRQPLGEDEEEQRGVVPPARGPIFSTFPQPQGVIPQRPGPPTATPGAVAAQPQLIQQLQQPPQQFFPTQPPVVAPQAPPTPLRTPGAQPSTAVGAVSTPGMIAPAPAQQPGQVAQPRRSPGEP